MSNKTELKTFYENIIAKIPGHIYWKDRNGIMLGCNDQQAKTLGYKSRHDVIGLSNYEMVVPNQTEDERKKQAEKISSVDNEVMQTGKPIVVEELVVLPDGSKRTFLSNKSPLYDNDNEIIGTLGISFDITDKKQLEKATQINEALTEQLKTLNLMANTIAHELRTPLSTIKNSTGALNILLSKIKSKLSDREQRQLAKISNLISNETIKTNHFINIILNNAKEIKESELSEISMFSCIYKAVNEFPFESDQDRQLIHINKKNHDFTFLGSQELMVHVLFNLIKNAIFFIHKAQKGIVEIWFTQDEKNNFLHFKDTGYGVMESELSHLFDSFYTKSTIGTGIGLAFCKKVMLAFHGSIHCESIFGEYTEFVMSFPKV